ncbi:hypothetical protein MES4922_40154 [Mesorhizobium ventifaucium]|uniref:Uncharacterized protein n=1 Tax=Mesorhizobium ventifaucium TaxID=666020 RepID=A0ABN8K782_9HYPH|nr:hypothetical protein MES4922_40154 [Mesorhizobium ventifaucium]
MTASKHGFAPGELNSPHAISAAVAAWHEPQTKVTAVGSFQLGTYGVVWAGRGKEGVLWGAGHSTTGVPMLALGIRRLLAEVPAGAEVFVQAHAELGTYIGPSGHIRGAMRRGGETSTGKPFAGYDVLREITNSHDEGVWTYQPGARPSAANRLGKATAIAQGPARLAGLAYQRSTNPSFVDSALGFIQTCEIPRPFTIAVEGP